MVQFKESLLRLQNYLYGNGSSSNSSCPSSPVKWCMNDFDGDKMCLKNPTLLPLCILALFIGIYCSKRIKQLPGKFPSRWYYQFTFFLYGIMMTSAGILHCVLGDTQQVTNTEENSIQFLRLFVTIIDVGLTSSIAVSFLFCGLCDIRFLNPQSMCTRCLLFCAYFIIFTLWTLGLIHNWNWIFNGLYTGVISISCFLYLITQLCIKSSRSALPVLFAGGIYGAIGLLAASFGANRVCSSEGPFWSQYIGPEFIWYLCSDVSVAFVCIYVTRANRQEDASIKKYPVDLEKNPEKF